MLKAAWHRVGENWSALVGLVRSALHKFRADRGNVLAAAMAYHLLLSLLPLLFLAVSITATFMGSSQSALEAVLKFIGEFAPVSQQALRGAVVGVLETRGTATGVGLLGLIWAGSQVFVMFERAGNQAWDYPDRNWLSSRLLSILTAFLWVFFIGAPYMLALVMDLVDELPLDLDWLTESWFANHFLLLALLIVGLTLFFRTAPNGEVSWLAAFLGSVVTGLLFEVARAGFAFYVGNFARFNLVYGSLAGLVVLLVWLYYISMVSVLGVELAAAFDRR